jgi:tetratricopeptide (TPR) repeat protein
LYLAAISLKEKTTGKDANYAGDIINLANLYRAERQFAKAETLFLEAKDIFENKVSQLEHPFYMTCLEGLAKLYFESGDYAKSGQFHAKALALREAVLGKDNLACALSHADMALLYWKTGDHTTAERHFSRGSQIMKPVYSQAARHQSEKEMFAYVRKFEIYLKQSLSFASANETATPGFVGECFDNALFYRGFLLNVSTQIRKQAMENKGLDDNFNLLKSYHRRLAAALAGPLADRDSAAISELEAQANALEKDLARTVAGFGEAIRQVGWQEVQAALQPGEAAVEFIHFNYFKPEDTDSVLYAAMLLKSGMEQPLFIPLFEEKTLEKLLPPPGKNRSEFVSQFYQNPALTDLYGRPSSHI